MYVLMSTVMVGVVPYAEYRGIAHPVSFLAERMNMRWLAVCTSFAALCGLTSVILGLLMGQPRIFYAMAKDGLLPPVAARVHPRFKTPYVTTIISGVLCALMGGLLPIDLLADMTSIGTLFAFVLCSLGVVVLRYTQPDAPRLFRVPTVRLPHCRTELHVVPFSSIACCMALAASTTSETLYRFFAWLVLGIVVYFSYGVWHSKLRSGDVAGAEDKVHCDDPAVTPVIGARRPGICE